MRRFLVVGSSILFTVVVACSQSAEGASTGGASAAEVSRCKGGCDKMKFFDCSSAEEQARCYGDCDAATTSQIEVFVGCAESSVCDPACRTKVRPAGEAPATGASATSCTKACQKLISCSYLKVGAQAACEAECQKSAYQYQIDCVDKHACAELPKVCGNLESSSGEGGVGGGGGVGADGGGGAGNAASVASCQAQCDALHFFECIDAPKLASCRTKCETATSTRETFSACVRTSTPDCARATPCLTAL